MLPTYVAVSYPMQANQFRKGLGFWINSQGQIVLRTPTFAHEGGDTNFSDPARRSLASVQNNTPAETKGNMPRVAVAETIDNS